MTEPCGTPIDICLILETISPFGQIVCDCSDNFQVVCLQYSMCSLAVSTQDSPAVEPRSNPGSGKILMSEISGCILHLQLSCANRQSALQ